SRPRHSRRGVTKVTSSPGRPVAPALPAPNRPAAVRRVAGTMLFTRASPAEYSMATATATTPPTDTPDAPDAIEECVPLQRVAALAKVSPETIRQLAVRGEIRAAK